ncbi:MAG: heme NO-binding domain-containing protein [Pirellulaceae bacterium]|nr:heme NO-binding domain-containing protein [Planctomycetales bacterium]
MKGIVFTCLNEMVEDTFGVAAWDDMLGQAHLDGVYTAADTYADAEMLALVGAMSDRTGTAPADLIREFGKYMLPKMAEQYPVFFPPGMVARQFLLSVHDIIHVEVKKLFPDAELPTFQYEMPADDQLVMVYRSRRQLCVLAEGLIEGAAAYFGEQLRYKQSQCYHQGDDHCRIEICFMGPGTRGDENDNCQ